MKDRTQLPHLIKLLDDDTPLVREAVIKALAGFGASLETELERLGIRASHIETLPIRRILENNRREEIKESWPRWFSIKGDKERLEEAMGMIVELQYGRTTARELPSVLDGLANECRSSAQRLDAMALAGFLFREKSLRGVDQGDYYNPLNSNITYVITEKRGIPISLACIYILVGHRLGLAIEGCNFPGHFLAIAPVQKTRVLVDCYNGGRTIDQQDLATLDARISMKNILQLECYSAAIVARVMRNLKAAYEHVRDAENARLIDSLLEMMNSEGSLSPLQ